MQAIMADNGTFYYNIQGVAEGTSYNIIYQDDKSRDFQPAIDGLLARFERSLSVYDEASIISRVNRSEDVEVDDFFIQVFTRAKEISALTNGTFDISAEPLFKAWGFSSGDKTIPSDRQIIELMAYIGMDKVELDGNHIVKSDPRVVLNVNAIAKGYSADIVANYIEEQGCLNYLVEIGGEIRLRGLNTEGKAWRIGIDRPTDDNLIPGQDLQVILQITDKGVATSGNYRQYYIEDGQKIAHTIDPVSGYPVKHNLLSVTVVADDAITADAFATAFMVGGADKAWEWIGRYPGIDALFICKEDGELKIYCTRGMEDYIVEIL